MKQILRIVFVLQFTPIWATPFLPSSFKAHFSQEYISSLSREKRSSRGEIHYRYPGHIRFSVSGKQNIVFVSNATKSWYYTAPFIESEPGELIVGAGGSTGQKKNPYANLFDILKQGLRDNRYYRISSDGKKLKKLASILTFTPAGTNATQIKRAKIFFKGKKRFDKIERIEVTFADEKNFTLNLSSIEANIKFKKGHFVFVPPPNTRQL